MTNVRDLTEIKEVSGQASCLLSRDELNTQLEALAKRMNVDLKDQDPIFVCVMIGGIIPFGQLVQKLDFPLTLDYLHVTRYTGQFSGGSLKWLAKPVNDLRDRTVVIVDDILDKGVTLANIVNFCKTQGAKRILTTVLLDKKVERSSEGLQKADYVVAEVEDSFVFGYGLDYKEYLRNMPGIYNYLGVSE